MNLDIATRLYTLQSQGSVSETVVEHKGFEEFCARLQHLVKAAASQEDDSWTGPLRKLRHYRFDQTAAPLGFGHKIVISDEKLEDIEAELTECATSDKQLSHEVSKLIDCLKTLARNNENPLFDEIKDHISKGKRTAILIKEGRHIPLVHELLEDCDLADSVDVVSQNQLRKLDDTFDLLLCVGRSGWYDEFIFRAPRATDTRVIRYSWLPDSDCRKTPVFKGWTELSSKLEAQNKLQRRRHSVTIGATKGERVWNLSDEELIPKFDLAVIAERFERGGRKEDDGIADEVAARLVELEGGRGTFVEADSGGILVIDLDENHLGNVGRVSISSIVPGMFLLLRGDSDSDSEYIIPIADLILGKKAEQLRRFQKAWKNKLRDLVKKEGIRNVVEKLKTAGSKKANEINLRNWLWHRNIRTDDPADFYAIMRVIDMGDVEEKCWRYSKQIDSAHRKAGRRIRNELLKQVREADLNELEKLGEMRFELEGIGGRPMVAVRIIRVSDFTSNVAPQDLNHLFQLEENLNG